MNKNASAFQNLIVMAPLVQRNIQTDIDKMRYFQTANDIRSIFSAAKEKKKIIIIASLRRLSS